ncbi:MAG: alpha-hydroxy-acid oxidizing protein [Gammaproteobacteria bacterium]|nr:alpha-hydroxy-acid oxidizing protein [Gammaproteobacteria bacterium]
MINRRALIRYLTLSPLLAGVPPVLREALAQESTEALLEAAAAGIRSPADALSVFDMESVARHVLPRAHWGYLSSGTDDNITRDRNHAAYQQYQLRARRLVDVSQLDTSVELFGRRWNTPILFCPIGGTGAFFPEAEVATARAARARDVLQILSTGATQPIEAVVEARGEPVWFQLYTTPKWEIASKLVKRAENIGCPVVAVTVDTPNGRNTEMQGRFSRIDERDCALCHKDRTKPAFAGFDMQGVPLTSASLTWDVVKRLKDVTDMKVVLKGLEDPEDAALAVEHGADGIIVSNHGGRAGEIGRSTLESLPGVVKAVAGRIPVIIDGGIRRGTDVFKALALGATAVGIGRPYIWGLAGFGAPGAERVHQLLERELHLAMGQTGTSSIAEISRSNVLDATW